MTGQYLSWFGIIRLGLVQTALGAIVVLTTSVLNRIMIVELGLAAMLPGTLVGLHYAVQMLRPRWGHGSDRAGRRTPWIIGGMAVLGGGALLAAWAVSIMATAYWTGLLLSLAAFVLIGVGVGASGTSLLVLLATRTAPSRRAAAASIVWMMMIAGFIVTAATVGQVLDPFSFPRLMAVTAAVSGAAFLLTLVAVWRVERMSVNGADASAEPDSDARKTPFMEALKQVWAEPQARQFTVFVFVSMLAYSAQDLILEPFAGLVFGMTPGETTSLAGMQHGGVLVGMILVALAGSARAGRGIGLRIWTVGGCLASAVALASLAVAGHVGPAWPLEMSVFALGLANGIFAVAAIGSMMNLANEGTGSREGVRMGLWGAAQAIAFGLGGFLGAAAVDAMRVIAGTPLGAYGTVFICEAVLFVLAAGLAFRIHWNGTGQSKTLMPAAGEGYIAGAAGR